MRSHEAGALHGQAGDRGPAWLRVPEDADELVPHLWAAGVSKVDGVLTVAGESAPDLAAEFGTPVYVVDEDDFRARARAFRDAFEGAPRSTTPARRSCAWRRRDGSPRRA